LEDKILIAYTSRTGSTGEVAETIAQVLRREGVPVDVRRVQEVKDLTPYQAVLIGSAIRMGNCCRKL